jgi:hypothetical protein
LCFATSARGCSARLHRIGRLPRTFVSHPDHKRSNKLEVGVRLNVGLVDLVERQSLLHARQKEDDGARDSFLFENYDGAIFL